ncbi:MAG: GFA family protein [Candidatus Binatia bacterium]
MQVPFTGGCACGAIRYRCTADPLFALNCHCRDCQRETGSAYAPILGVPAAAFAVTHGSPRYFEVQAESGATTRRAFCGDCGSALFGAPGSNAGMATIRAASLDDPSQFRPVRDIFVASAQPWDCMSPDLPKTQRLG